MTCSFRFAEIIPQSIFTRHGLYLGAKMAGFTKCLIYGMVRRLFLFDCINMFILISSYTRESYRGLLQSCWSLFSDLTMESSIGEPVGIPDYQTLTGSLLLSLFPTELKELIAMHSSLGAYGGDLKSDTVTIIGATLDLQEKVVRQVIYNSLTLVYCD